MKPTVFTPFAFMFSATAPIISSVGCGTMNAQKYFSGGSEIGVRTR